MNHTNDGEMRTSMLGMCHDECARMYLCDYVHVCRRVHTCIYAHISVYGLYIYEYTSCDEHVRMDAR